MEQKPLTPEQKNHWAYRQGYAEGLAGEKSKRGWMAFGLSCAATPLDALNTRLWLAGFDEAINLPKEVPNVNDYNWTANGKR